MKDNLHNLVLDGIRLLLLPLAAAAKRDVGGRLLFELSGWKLEPGSDPVMESGLRELIDAYEGLDEFIEDPPETLVDVSEGLNRVHQLIASVRQVQAQPGTEGQGSAELGEDLIKPMAVGYLKSWHPALYDALTLLTVIRPSAEIALECVHELLEDPLKVLRAEYFAPEGLAAAEAAEAVADKLFPRLAALMVDLGFHAVYRIRTENGLESSEASDDLGAGVLTVFLQPDFEQENRFGATLALSPMELGDVALVVMPFGEMSPDLGLVMDLPPAGFSVGPKGFTLLGTAGTSSVRVDSRLFTYPGFVVGSMNGTRLEIGKLEISGDAALSMGDLEYGVLLDLGPSALVISGGDGDGFLQEILTSEGVRADFDLGIGWSNKRGLYFRGSAGLDTEVALNRSLFGFLELRSIHLSLTTDGSEIQSSVAAALGTQVGPVEALVDGVGLEAVASFPKEGGNLGLLELSFGFKPPARIGLSIDAQGIKGGGFLAIDPPNYAGALELTFQDEIEVAAFGLITTRLPDGQPGFSLVISILAEFQPIQLGLGFALTGVGGLIGINRRMDEDALRETVKNHSLDAILFPSSPIRDAVKVIDAIQRILPPKEGVHVFGPMAELIWGGSVTLVEFHLGIFIEIGGPVRVALMGQAKSELPDKKAPMVVLNMDLLGFIDFGRETVAIDSSLFDSHIQKVPISGQMALRASWGENADFAMSVGGFHPRFTPPPGFPALQRLALTLGDGNPRIALTAYLAITSNSLQFGARLELWAKKAGFAVTGGLAFDALFIFHPFSFEIAAEAWVDVRRGSVVLLGVALSLTLSGPNPFRATGYAKIKICWFLTIKVRFDKTFGKRIQPSQPVVSPLAVLRGELEEPRNTRFELPEWASAMLVFAEGAEDRLDRAGAWVFSQNAVPLNFPMERFGGGVPPTAERELRVEASPPGGSPLPGEAVEARFAPEQFHDWTVEEKLSAPAFESFESGLRLDGGLATAPEASHRHMPIEFETIVKESQAYLDSLPDGSPKKASIRYAGSWAPAPARTRNWSRAGGQAVFAPRRRRKNRSHRNYVRVAEPTFAVAGQDAVDGLFQPAAAAGSSRRMTYSQATRITRRSQDLVLRHAATVTKGG